MRSFLGFVAGFAAGAIAMWLVARGPGQALVFPRGAATPPVGTLAPAPVPMASPASPLAPPVPSSAAPLAGEPPPSQPVVPSAPPWVLPPEDANPLGTPSPSPVPGDSTDAHLDARTLVAPDASTNVLVAGDLDRLRARNLLFPVRGFDVRQLRDTFAEKRGDRVHEALDMLAPRGTPVVAVDDGRVAKLFASKAGGLTVYQFDPAGGYAYYYAHLDRYAPGLHDGQALEKGDVIGFVGTTGNAPPNVPHLHFTIFKLGPDRRWWEGKPLDPYPLWAMR